MNYSFKLKNMTTDPSLTLAQLGEQGLLARLEPFCAPGLIGDDAAVLPPSAAPLVITSDVLIDGVHFSLGWGKTTQTTPPHAVGWRSAAANLSDLAAMGAQPTAITIALALPPSTPVLWIEEIYRGISDCLGQYGGVIVGGDLTRSSVLTIAITAFGAGTPRSWLRSTAQPGDAIVITGWHGLARAGLACLLDADLPIESASRYRLIHAHQYPQPRLDLRSILSTLPRVTAMDSSDGLADAVIQIARASHVGAQLWRDRLPIHPALAANFSPTQALDWLLYGGEDFELVLALPILEAQHLQDSGAVTIVGTMTAGVGVVLINEGGDSIELSLVHGFQHF